MQEKKEDQEKDLLFEYIGKIKNVIDCLARGTFLLTSKGTNICIDDDVAVETNLFMVEEFNRYDVLEMCSYNEMGSLRRIIEFIEDGDYALLEEIIKEVVSYKYEKVTQSQEDIKKYNAIMSRAKRILSDIVIKLTMGLLVEPDQDEVMNMFVTYLNEVMTRLYNEEKEDRKDNGNEEIDDDINYLELKERAIEEINRKLRLVGGEASLNEMGKIGFEIPGEYFEKIYISYNSQENRFSLMCGNVEVLSEIDIPYAVSTTVNYIYDADMRKKAKEEETGKEETVGYKYRGMRVKMDEER